MNYMAILMLFAANVVNYDDKPKKKKKKKYKCDSWSCFDLNLGMQMDSRI